MLITAALLDAYPAAVVLGEEAYAHDPALLDRFSTADHAFTVDPVDGTKNFVHGSKDHAVMVAEVRAGEVTRVLDLAARSTRRRYVAERGAGAFRTRTGGAPERLSRPAAPPVPLEWRTVTSRRSWVGRELTGLRPLELTWVCCGVDYAHLVEGHADVVLYGHANAWDHAPGALLLTESGGRHGTHRRPALRPALDRAARPDRRRRPIATYDAWCRAPPSYRDDARRQQAEARSSASLAAYPSESEPSEPPVTLSGLLLATLGRGAALALGAVDRLGDLLLDQRRCRGRPVLISGGTSESVATFWSRAFRASGMNRSISEAGRLVEMVSVEALARSSKFADRRSAG